MQRLTPPYSYGILFLDTLLSAADVESIGGQDRTVGYSDYWENTNVSNFNIREPGLNVDYMTYSMLRLANDDYRALLDHEQRIPFDRWLGVPEDQRDIIQECFRQPTDW